MSYRERAPAIGLVPWVECAWQRSGDGREPVRVVPDGCIDIVWSESLGMQVVGANTTAFLVRVPAGARVAGVRMRPGAGAALLGVDAGRLRDARIALQDVWDDDGRRLEERVARCQDPAGELLGALVARVPRIAAPDPLVRAAVAQLQDPSTRVEALARELGVSARQLRRRFEAAVGYGPKRLACVLRLERALRAARAGEELALAAVTAGYADQAHFTHDCRALAGVPPAALLAGDYRRAAVSYKTRARACASICA